MIGVDNAVESVVKTFLDLLGWTEVRMAGQKRPGGLQQIILTVAGSSRPVRYRQADRRQPERYRELRGGSVHRKRRPRSGKGLSAASDGKLGKQKRRFSQWLGTSNGLETRKPPKTLLLITK